MHDAYQNTGEYKKKKIKSRGIDCKHFFVLVILPLILYKKHFSYTFLCYSENLVYSAVEYLVLFSRKSKEDKERILRVQ